MVGLQKQMAQENQKKNKYIYIWNCVIHKSKNQKGAALQIHPKNQNTIIFKPKMIGIIIHKSPLLKKYHLKSQKRVFAKNC